MSRAGRDARIRTVARDNTWPPEFHDEIQDTGFLVDGATPGLDSDDKGLDHADGPAIDGSIPPPKPT
jgi:hypothetical protein